MIRVLLLALWLLPLPVQAQPDTGIALKLGPNAATLAEEGRMNRYGVTGGAAGYLQWPLTNRWLLSGEIDLLYTPRGSRVMSEGGTRGHYIDIVIAARPEARLGLFSTYVLLGGGINFLTSAHKEDLGVVVDITDDLRGVDVALLVGAGVGFHLPHGELGPFRTTTFFIEVRHDRGLFDTDMVNGGFKNRNTSIMFGVSLLTTSTKRKAL